MKKILSIAILLCFGVAMNAQNKNARATIDVDGVCMMCKERIEKGTIKTKGVKSAVWDVKTHELSVIYDERKTDLATIHQKVASLGHDTKEVKAPEEAYQSLHPCCLYRDEDIQKDHQDE